MLPVDVQTPGTTDNGVVAVSDPIVAEIVAEPTDAALASPVDGPMVATDGVSEVQLAAEVTFCVLPSAKVPVAISCWLDPRAMVAGLGVIAIDTTVTTDNGAVAVIDPIVAEIVAEPAETPVASPVDGPMLATEGVSEVQLAAVVTFCVVPSE